jgi:hypothetical protein
MSSRILSNSTTIGSVFGTNSMTPRGAMPVSHDTTPSSGTFFEIATW